MEANTNAQPLTVSWEMLEKSLAHPNALIREKAIESAGRFGDPRVLSALQTAVRDDDPRIRSAAAQAFVSAIARRHPEIDSALAQLISAGADEELRRFLVSISATSDSPPLLRAVIECLVESCPAVRFAAETSLHERGRGWMFTMAASEAIPVIEAARQSSQAEVSAAARSWGEMLRRAQVRRTMLDTGVAAVLTLTGALRGGSVTLRVAAAWALAESGDQRAAPALVDALGDSNETVRRASAVSLARLRWGATTEEERAAQLVALGRWDEVVQLGTAAVDSLLLAAMQSSPATQAQAIAALAQLKSVRALLPLQDSLKSPDAVVRRAAAAALKALEWVPATDAQAVAQAIELEDWPAASAVGATAVEPLVAELKTSHGRPERAASIAGALGMITETGAAKSLVAFSRDGEVAAASVQSLESLLKNSVREISDEVLTEIAALNNVVQFEFTIDPQYQQPVRSGMKLVNVESLREIATRELSRRAFGGKAREPS